LLDFVPANVGDEGLSTAEPRNGESMEELELGYLKCPRLEKLGVTGEGISVVDEF
jgi:hypothetical protein